MISNVGSLISNPVDSKDANVVAAKVQSMFMEVMIKAMEDSIGADDGLYGDSSSSEIYRGMFREQLGATLGQNVGGSLQADLVKGMLQSQKKLLDKIDGSALPSDLDFRTAAPDLSGSGAAGKFANPVNLAKLANLAITSAPAPTALPVAGIVTSEVGWRKDPFSGALAFHKGTDIAAPVGTSIHAVAAGTVVESGPKGEYGNAVVIRTDDGRRMLYGHNSVNYVQAGDRVELNEAIAAVGSTGKATGPHVHFEVTE